MSPALDGQFLRLPMAHRGLHDAAKGRPENSIAAMEAAIVHGYGIEIDVQLTGDDRAAVFHDYDLDRLTAGRGKVRNRTLADLATIYLSGSSEGIPGLAEVLRTVAGQVPLVIEIKDQDGALGPDVGPLEGAVATAIHGYEGPLAVMSFNPHSMAAMQALSPEVARGLVTCAFRPGEEPGSQERLAQLAKIADFERVGASFISHDVRDLANPAIQRLKDAGAPVLCWTVRSLEVERAARKVADNITFEHYLPALPA
ncbi:MAG: phosphodiesterase [Silicimonas sp.]|nr:phosphodiesterase [Silicimonas sp.]